MAAVILPAGEEQTWLGTFGERWFLTVCSVAGCATARPEPDLTGADFVVHDHCYEAIRVQVKTTVSASPIDGAFRFPLDVRTYDRLRQGSTAGYLALVVVSAAHPRWAGFCQRGSIVRAVMYWAPLAGLPATTNTYSITLSLPQGNMLTPETLLGLFPEGGEAGGTVG